MGELFSAMDMPVQNNLCQTILFSKAAHDARTNIKLLNGLISNSLRASELCAFMKA
jgi:hypothetical protein